MATSVTQNGITLTFAADHTIGQYANGDYYIVAPAGLTITDIDPPSLLVASRPNDTGDGANPMLNTYSNGAMVNPDPTVGKQGFDSAIYNGGYLSSLNAARPGNLDLNAGNPLVITPDKSLVCSISNNTVHRPALTNAAVFTIVATAPAANSFRPPYSNTDKTVLGTVADLDYTFLGSNASVASEPTLASIESSFSKFWFDFPYIDSDLGRYLHPTNQMPDHAGSHMAPVIKNVCLILTTDYSDAQKETLLIRIVQYGIDIYGVALTGEAWTANGGHGLGRKLPLLIAGNALNHAGMLAYGNKATHNIFQEDQQTFLSNTAQLSIVPYNGDGRLRLPYKEAVVTFSGSDITWPSAHGFQSSQPITFTSTGTLPSPLTLGEQYKILSSGLTSNVFRIAKTGSTPWTLSGGSGTLTATMVGIYDWGEKHSTDKTRDGSNWNTYYRDINYVSTMGFALCAYMMGMRAQWNWEPFFLYHERIRNISIDNGWGSWVNNMWWAYGYGDVPTGPPDTPVIGVATVNGPSSVTVAFTDASDDETHFELLRATTSGGTYSVVATVEPNTPSATDNTPAPNRTYYYKVRAVNSQGSSTSVDYVSATTPLPSPSGALFGSAIATF